eukprot:Sdes_comp22854_c0_seq1m21234
MRSFAAIICFFFVALLATSQAASVSELVNGSSGSVSASGSSSPLGQEASTHSANATKTGSHWFTISESASTHSPTASATVSPSGNSSATISTSAATASPTVTGQVTSGSSKVVASGLLVCSVLFFAFF